jgi:hypothetical protein
MRNTYKIDDFRRIPILIHFGLLVFMVNRASIRRLPSLAVFLP